jgi:OFA family oxalate/formate antiporter-like MFS transporter
LKDWLSIMNSKIFYGWWVVSACSLISLYVGGVVFFGFTAFFEPIRQTFGWSHTQISFAGSLQGVEVGLFAPFAGILVDRFGARVITQVGLIIVGAGLFWLSRVQSLVMFYAAFLFISFGAGGCTAVVTLTAIANWFNKKASLAMGLLGAGVGAGGLIVVLIVFLIDRFQWRTTLVVLGVGMFLLGLPLAALIKDRPESIGLSPDGVSVYDNDPQAKGAKNDADISLGEAFRSRRFVFLSVVEMIRLAAIPAVLLHVMPYLSSLGVSRSTSGTVAAAIPLVGIFGRIGFGWLGDLYQKRYVMALTFLLLSLGILAFGFADNMWLILPFLICFPLGHSGSMVLRSSIVRDFFGRRAYGRILGIVLGAGAVGGIIGPTGAGWIYDTTGSYHLVWLILCGMTALATVLVLKLK